MRLENFLALTHGKLLNEPCVNSFENIVFEAHRVKRGDIYFAFDEQDIELAVQNGAYAIIFEDEVFVSDEEIAWIKVVSLDDAIKRLVRFRMIEQDIVAYECNEIILKLSLQTITQNNFFVLHGDIKSNFKPLWQLEQKTTVLFCPTLNSKDIFANINELSHVEMQEIDIVEQTLFETSFIYDDIFYERQLISPFFMPYLEELLHLYKSLKINFKLKKFTPIEHFEAVFTNKNFEIKNFGTSDKVLIFEPNSSLIESEIRFLQNNASWAKLIILLPATLNKDEDKNIITYKHEKDILNILKNNSFHFALVVGVSKIILNKPLTNQKQLTIEF
ncbi:MAG: hypothetical protein GXO30_04045 [Epsilonproteobacteria bacterium]|nr:hypothetical protein [Campylobacterota bacterium]